MTDAFYVDLFAGCGGLSLGLERAGLVPKLLLERDEWACKTLATNFPHATVWQRDIRTVRKPELDWLKGVDVLVGGPPCQGFSVAGASQFGMYDSRNSLVLTFLEWVKYLQPKIAVIENVPAILTKRDQQGNRFEDLIRRALEDLDYSVSPRILDAAHYGAPQHRRRVFFLARREGVPLIDLHPTHGECDSDILSTSGDSVRPVMTVWEAISDLPQIRAGEGMAEGQPYPHDPQNEFQARLRQGSTMVRNHVAMKHTRRLIERFRWIQPGQSLKDVAKAHGQLQYRKGKISDKPFKSNNYRLAADRPSLAIPASFQSLFLHPYLDRNLTAREAARLFGYPDKFVFEGKRTTMSWERHLSQYNQIGNSVSPLVSEALGRSIIESLRSSRDRTFPYIEGIDSRLDSGVEPFRVNHEYRPSEDLISILEDAAIRTAGRNFKAPSESGHSDLGATLSELALALYLICTKNCPICRTSLPPHGLHDGKMVFAISKDNTQSLLEREKDHGLDFHMRVILGTRHDDIERIHVSLQKIGWVSETVLRNPRTGRNVRGVEARKSLKLKAHEIRMLDSELSQSICR